MDAPTIIAAVAVVTPLGTGVLGYLWTGHQKRIKQLEDGNAAQVTALATFKLDNEKAMAKMQRDNSEEVAATERKLAAFEVDAYKTFITQPALVQVMNSLDKTLEAMGALMQENQRETRAGLNALNERIDSIFAERRAKP